MNIYLKKKMSHVSFLLRLSLAYVLLYSVRNLITSSSAYLFDEGALSEKTYAVMQTTSYFVIFLCKISSGLLMRQITSFNRLLAVFFAIQVCTLLSYVLLFSVGVAAKDWLASCFVFVYAIVKITSSFMRVTALEMVYQGLQDLRVFGHITTLFQLLSCVGDAGGKYALGGYLQLESLKTFAQSRGLPLWSIPMLCVGATVIFGIVSTATLFRRRASSKRDGPPKRSVTSARKNVLRLARNPSFLLCCLSNLVTSMISVSMGSYGTHYMRYRLQIDSAKIPIYDGVSPVIILFAISGAGYLMTSYRDHKYRLALVMLLPLALAILNTILLRYVLQRPMQMLAFYYQHQFCFYAMQNLLDGAYLMCIVENDLAPIATGIVSGIGYIGGLTVPFVIMPYSTNFDGWQIILPTILALEVFLAAQIIVLSVIDARRK